MGKVLSTQDKIEKVILVGVWLDNGEDEERLLDELEELVKTAGGVVVGRVIQSREQFHPTTYVGKGKLDEIRVLIDELDATGIVCDDELSPAQLKNLEDELNTKVLDRTMVILDIFAARANTSEGKIQVEMAQLQYRMTRLSGFGKALSRLGGGIGTRGPGEKKIETDRRVIRERISKLSVQLKELEQHRQTIRKKRTDMTVPIAAIVGYTNAGKSTLLNKLTDAGVLSEDKLFATLDPTTRALMIPDGEKVLLIEAFKSTLQEAKFADIIIHVVDSSNPDMDKHIQTVYEILESLDVGDKPIITLYNKSDIAQNDICGIDPKAKQTIKISAKTGAGLDIFLKELQNIIWDGHQKIETLFSYAEAGKIQTIREYGKILKEEYREDGIYVEALMPK